MSSEVAALKERLRLEAEAMYRGMYGYAEVARHEIINRKMESLGKIGEQLRQYLGREETAKLVIETMDQAEQKGRKPANDAPPAQVEEARSDIRAEIAQKQQEYEPSRTANESKTGKEMLKAR
jgi:hypothetical protein